MTELSGPQTGAFHDLLSQAGFRRSHGLAYVPICPGCSACMAVRVKAMEFRASRTQRRIRNKNAHLSLTEVPARATEEHFRLFSDYQRTRHGGSEMSLMDFQDYRALVETTPVETRILEFRDAEDTLVAACLTDHMADGYSAVYSFFDPDREKDSLGTYLILALIERAAANALPHVYLGFWIAECRKMSYKTAFRPLEIYTRGEWQLVDREDPIDVTDASAPTDPRRTAWQRIRNIIPE